MRNLYSILILFFLSIVCFGQTREYLVKTSDDVSLFTKKSGKGAVCIFVHGGPGMWSKSFEDLGGNTLEDQLTMVYFDQRGSGRSTSSATASYGLERLVEDIEEVRQTLKVDQVYLMGHSFGGILVTHYAKKYPQHLKGIVLLNATLDINASMKAQVAFVNDYLGTSIPIEGDQFMQNFGQARQLMAEQQKDYLFLTSVEANFKLLDQVDAKKPNQYDFGSKIFNHLEYIENHTLITNTISTPVLVIAGRKDYAIGVEHYKDFKFSNMTLQLLDGGHLLYYEKNEAFKKAVIDFTKKLK